MKLFIPESAVKKTIKMANGVFKTLYVVVRSKIKETKRQRGGEKTAFNGEFNVPASGAGGVLRAGRRPGKRTLHAGETEAATLTSPGKSQLCGFLLQAHWKSIKLKGKKKNKDTVELLTARSPQDK